MIDQTINTESKYVIDSFIEDTDGGLICEVLILDDGTVLEISSEAVVLYPSLLAWQDNPRNQLGVIYRQI